MAKYKLTGAVMHGPGAASLTSQDVLAKIYGAGAASPTFQDVLAKIEGAGIKSARAGLAELETIEGIRPETQKILDEIREQSEVGMKMGISTARALAEKRGIEGSSIEQFGVQSAVKQSEQVRQAAELPVLQQELGFNEELTKLRAHGLFGIGEMERSNAVAAAQLTSDELATIRNLMENDKNRELQKYLGERGIAVSMANASAAASAARDQAKQNLLGQVLGGITTGVTAGLLPF